MRSRAKRCKTCGKARYATKEAAELAIARLRLTTDVKRSYFDHGWWHVTSQTKAKSRRGNRNRQMANATRVLIILSCNHKKTMAENMIGKPVSCYQCNGELMRVKDVVIKEWHVRCHSCVYSRWCGLDRNTAKLAGNTHANSSRHQDIDVEFEDNPAAIRVLRKLRERSTI